MEKQEVFYRVDHIPDEETDDWRATGEIIVSGVGMVHVLVYGDNEQSAFERLCVALDSLVPEGCEYTQTDDLIPYG